MTFRILNFEEYPQMLPLIKELNPNADEKTLVSRILNLQYDQYKCLAVFDQDEMIAICGMWICHKIYIGLQMEIDNVVVSEKYRSKGIGDQMMDWVNSYAKELGCASIELNTYVTNTRSHKFYMNKGFDIKGYHMIKKL